MKNLLIKECKLASSPLSWIFLAFTLMTMLPGYPILLGAFFICFGIFHSFQNARENNDILFTVLLPVSKADVVRGKYAFTCLIQMLGFVIMLCLTLVRMLFISNAEAYLQNALMNANPFYLAWVLVIFLLFNTLFLGGFFRTGYKFGGPFILFGCCTFLAVTAAEILHYIPGMAMLNATAFADCGSLWLYLILAALLYVGGTFLSCRVSAARFEKIDL